MCFAFVDLVLLGANYQSQSLQLLLNWSIKGQFVVNMMCATSLLSRGWSCKLVIIHTSGSVVRQNGLKGIKVDKRSAILGNSRQFFVITYMDYIFKQILIWHTSTSCPKRDFSISIRGIRRLHSELGFYYSGDDCAGFLKP